MGSERVGELPENLEAWVAERAEADGTTRDDVVRRLITAHRLVEEHPERLEDAEISGSTGSDAIAPSEDSAGDVASAGDGDDHETDVASVETELDDLETEFSNLETQLGETVAELDDLTARIGALEDDLDEKIDDVRQRVIQVKRETDAKAPADHDHPDIERRMAEGFENYEEILEYLTEQTDALTEQTETLRRRTDGVADRADEHGDKLKSVASAVVDLRKRVSGLERAVEKRDATAELQREANRHGITAAACESCGESVQLGLLDEPVCPHCESPFDGIDPKTGFFGSNRLTVGRRPALESAPTADPDTGTGATSQGERAEPTSNSPAAETAATESEERTNSGESGRFAGATVDPPGGDAGGDESSQAFEDDIGDLDSDSVNDGNYGATGSESADSLRGSAADAEGSDAPTTGERTESDGGTDPESRGDSPEGSDTEFRFGPGVQDE